MIKQKEKKCGKCKEMKLLFSKGLCKPCWQQLHSKPIKKTPLKVKEGTTLKASKKPIKPYSKKQYERLKKYKELRDKLQANISKCQICLNNPPEDCHHPWGRIGDNLYRDLMFICRRCHEYLHNNPKESYEKGWLKSRLN